MLFKSVVQSMPTFAINIFLIISTLSQELEKMMVTF